MNSWSCPARSMSISTRHEPSKAPTGQAVRSTPTNAQQFQPPRRPMSTPSSPLSFSDDDLALPEVVTELPGPLSQKWFDQIDSHLTAALADHAAVPFVEVRRRGHLIEDVDGNTFADHMSAWGASPFGPTPPRIRDAMLSAWDAHGMQISAWQPN